MRSTSAATRSSRTLHLARDVMQLPAYVVPHGRHHPAGIQPLLPDSNHTCSHDVTPRIPKANLALQGVPHASTCALPDRNLRSALCEQNTLRRLRRVSHTCPPGEPIHSESITSLPFVRPRDRLTSTAGVSGPGFTPAGEHVAASCQARPEPRARRRANPARFPMQLRPRLGPCPLCDAVVVAIPPTHTCVSRRSDTIPSHSHRETRLHVRSCPPSSPSHTTTLHTLFLSHSAAHSLVPFPSHTPYHSHTRGHSPAVFHSHRPAVRTRVPFPSHTRPLPLAVPLSHTACWEARTPAHS